MGKVTRRVEEGRSTAAARKDWSLLARGHVRRQPRRRPHPPLGAWGCHCNSFEKRHIARQGAACRECIDAARPLRGCCSYFVFAGESFSRQEEAQEATGNCRSLQGAAGRAECCRSGTCCQNCNTGLHGRSKVTIYLLSQPFTVALLPVARCCGPVQEADVAAPRLRCGTCHLGSKAARRGPALRRSARYFYFGGVAAARITSSRMFSRPCPPPWCLQWCFFGACKDKLLCTPDAPPRGKGQTVIVTLTPCVGVLALISPLSR